MNNFYTEYRVRVVKRTSKYSSHLIETNIKVFTDHDTAWTYFKLDWENQVEDFVYVGLSSRRVENWADISTNTSTATGYE